METTSTLLFVDDEEHNRDILSRQLQKRGFDVLLAENGGKALTMVDTEDVDLVILDIMMPGIDGLEVLRQLRQTHSPAELPILMATAKTDSADIVQCAELGANDHVGKPFDVDVIVAKVKGLLRLKAAAAPPDDGEPALSDLREGAMLAKKYRLGKKIGAGTFGAVFQARHEDLDLDVAIKILQPSLTASDASLQRFRQEGVAACKVRHPNAVLISDYGVTSTGVAFLVMELLNGRSLDDELDANGALPPRRVNDILQPVCDVLAEAHAQALVHRDIKPENIFLHHTERAEVVKVLDFGIAKLVGEAAVQDNLTADGWILGTPAYMAPERLSKAGYDGRADVYSLGIMLFEMLTGQQPFDMTSKDLMSIMAQHVNEEPPTLRSIRPNLSFELERPVAWALAKEPRERPTPRELAKAFGRAVARAERAAALEADDTSTQVTKATVPMDPKILKPEGGRISRFLKKLRKSD